MEGKERLTRLPGEVSEKKEPSSSHCECGSALSIRTKGKAVGNDGETRVNFDVGAKTPSIQKDPTVPLKTRSKSRALAGPPTGRLVRSIDCVGSTRPGGFPEREVGVYCDTGVVEPIRAVSMLLLLISNEKSSTRPRPAGIGCRMRLAADRPFEGVKDRPGVEGARLFRRCRIVENESSTSVAIESSNDCSCTGDSSHQSPSIDLQLTRPSPRIDSEVQPHPSGKMASIGTLCPVIGASNDTLIVG